MKPVAGLIIVLSVLFGMQDKGNDARAVFLSDIPSYTGNVILARPTDRSVTGNVMLNRTATVRIVYGADGRPDRQTEPFNLRPGEPREVVLDDLPPDAACHYRLVDTETKRDISPESCAGSFHTRRPPGSGFTFTVQADSHLDGNCLPELYKLTIANAVSANPDFHIDLGDTFMTGKIPTREEAAKQYLAQRYYLGLVGHTAPIFLVLGNHDGEGGPIPMRAKLEEGKNDSVNRFLMGEGRNGVREADGPAVWSCLQRKRYFTNPVPDSFYSGNAQPEPHAGLLQDYYSFEWGDALFVVLDPYWYSQGTRGGEAPWNMTIGKTQYDWLARTLKTSKAKFKFVFIHQLVGGLDKGGRGGAEAAMLYEWGGREKDGSDTFGENRPGWGKPIHSLLVEAGVTIVFHGHDHFFARQERDGILYQLVPQPAHRNFRNHQAKEYGYEKGDFLPNSGYLRVRVNPEQVTVDYIRTADEAMQRQGIPNARSVNFYTCR